LSNIDEFYLKYLGANHEKLASGQSVFSSPFLGQPEFELSQTVHDLIVSIYGDVLIHSINQRMINRYRDFAPREISEKLVEQVDNAFFKTSKYNYYWISEWFRYSISSSFDNLADITVLAKNHRAMFEARRPKRRGRLFKDQLWEKTYLPLIENGRMMAVIKDGKIASFSTVTDLPFGGANIAVVTYPEFRKKGYGAKCVKKAVNWCNENNRIPIYLVSSSNASSIGLAEKLGFKRFSREIRTKANAPVKTQNLLY